MGQTTATQSVSLRVLPISMISVKGNPAPLVISDFEAGSTTAAVSDQSSTYSIATNKDSKRILASMDEPMPSGTKLVLHLQSTKGSSAGTVDISGATEPVEVVNNIARGQDSDQRITYTFIAAADAGQFSSVNRTITLTITD